MPPAPIRAGSRFTRLPQAIASDAIAGLLLALFGAVTTYLLAAQMHGPIAYPDELGYFQNAQLLAGEGSPFSAKYYPGYSILLALPATLGESVFTEYRLVLAINIFLSAITHFVGYILFRRLFPRVNPEAAMLIVIIGLLYPSRILYGSLILSENLLLPWTILTALAIWNAAERNSHLSWIFAASASGFTVLIHPRGVAHVLGFIVIVLWHFRGTRRLLITGFMLICMAVATVFVSLVITQLFQASGPNVTSDYQPGVLKLGYGFALFRALIGTLSGQALYLLSATFGLVIIGIAWLVRTATAQKRSEESSPCRVVAGYLLVVAFATFGISAAALANTARTDHIFYGRYNEAIAPLLVLIALGAVETEWRKRGTFFLIGLTAGSIFISGAVVALVIPDGLRSLTINPMNIMAILPVIGVSSQAIEIWPIVVFGIVLALVTIIVFRWRMALGLALVGLCFVTITGWVAAEYLLPGSRARASQRVVASTVEEAADRFDINSCVDLELQDRDWYGYNYLFFLSNIRFGQASDSCDFVIAEDGDPSWQLVVRENYSGPALWVRPGAVRGQLGSAGWLSAPDAGPLPTDAMRAELDCCEDLSGQGITVNKGERPTAVIRVRHTGSDRPWQSDGADTTYPVRLGVRWFSTFNPGLPAAEARVQLPRTLMPGQSVTLRMPLIPPEGLLAGNYEVRIDMVEEGINWFADRGGQNIRIPLRVRILR